MSTTRTARLLTAAVALALGAGLAAPAHATSTTRTDPEGDVFLAGVGGGLDLASVRLATANRDTHVRITVRLHSAAANRGLARPGGLAVQFSRSHRASRVVEVFRAGGGLRAEVCSQPRAASSEPVDCTPVRVSQPDARTFRAVVRLDLLDEGAEVLRWTASSLDLSTGDPVSDRLTAANGKPFRWRL